MLDRKKVLTSQLSNLSNGILNKVSVAPSTTTNTSKTDKTPTGVTGMRAVLKAKRQISNVSGSSMMNLVKTVDNQGQGAKTKKPIMFGAPQKRGRA